MSKRFERVPCVMKGVPQIASNVTKGTPLYADYVIVGDLVFISGQTAVDPETGICTACTIREQMEVIMGKIDAIMQKCGSSLEYLVKDFIIMKDMKDYPIMRLTQQEYYAKHAPALLDSPPGSTIFEAAELGQHHYLVEIEAIGYIPSKEDK